MSTEHLTESLKQQRNDQGQVRIWDVHQKKYVYVWAPDAREMIAGGSAQLSKPDDEPVPAPSSGSTSSTTTNQGGSTVMDPVQLSAEQLLTMEGDLLHELAVKQGIKNLSKLSREQIVEAIANKLGIELD